MIEARGADGKIGMISEQEYYMRIALEMPESDDRACQVCRGAGYVRYERPVGNLLFGKARTCPGCCPQSVEVPEDARYGT